MPEIGLKEATAIAREVLETEPRHGFTLLEKQTRKLPGIGWVFFYAPERFLATGNPKYLVPGNSPLVVHNDRSVRKLSTAVPADKAIEQYRESLLGLTI